MEKNWVSALTALEATETTKKLLDTIDVPQGVTKLVEVAIQVSMAGLTTLEDFGGILEIESDNAQNWTTQSFLSDVAIPLTSGVAAIKPTIHDCNIPVRPGDKLKMSFTANRALTINPSVRVGGKFV